MSSINSLELEQEIAKMARAMMTRNTEIGEALIGNLRIHLTLEDVAGVMLVSIERLIGYDIDSVFWTLQNLMPADVMREIHKIMSAAFCKQLISKGFVPGKDFSANAVGHLLLTDRVKAAVLPGCSSVKV